MALNPSGGPSMNCTTCTGVVTVDNSAGTATYNAEYYVLGQASKFVKPGAVRIDSNTFGSGNLEDVAFRNPDGSNALIALNADTSSAHTFNVDENGQYFTYTLPARAVATFTWTPGSTSTGGGISSSTWYEVVNTNSGDCVDDTNGGTANGTAVQQWACSAGSANQEWQFQPTSGGYYQVVTRNAPSRGLGRHRRAVRHRQRHPDPAVERYRRHQPAVAAHAAIRRQLHLHRPQQRQRMPGRHQPLDRQRHAAAAVGLHRR